VVTGVTDERTRPATELDEDEVSEATPVARAAAAGADGSAGDAPVHISGSRVSGLRAHEVRIEQSSVEDVEGQRVELTGSSVRHAEGKLVQMNDARAVRVDGTRVVAEQVSVVGIVGEQIRVVRGTVGFAIAGRLELGGESRVIVHLGAIRSTVRPLVSTKTAAAFGAGLGAALAVGAAVLGRRAR
jgi:hypothetical protein